MEKIEILNMWKKDSKIDSVEIDRECFERFGELHHKYWEILLQESQDLRRRQYQLALARRYKTEYYMGRLSDEKLREMNWKPFGLKIMKGDLDTYLNADKDLNTLKSIQDDQQETVDLLRDIIQQIRNRSYLINLAQKDIALKLGKV